MRGSRKTKRLKNGARADRLPREEIMSATRLLAMAASPRARHGLGLRSALPRLRPAAPSQHVPLQKTIGQGKAEVVPSLIVLNASGATLQGGKLTLTGVAPNSIVFADRPVEPQAMISRRMLSRTGPSGSDNFANDPPNATVSGFSKDGGPPRCGRRAQVAEARRRQAHVRRRCARRRPRRRRRTRRRLHRHHRPPADAAFVRRTLRAAAPGTPAQRRCLTTASAAAITPTRRAVEFCGRNKRG